MSFSVRAKTQQNEGRAPVVVRHLKKVYEPSPLWMRFLLRSAIEEPVVALADVSFEVKRGHICAVVGPNGAGKSTLFRVLTGLTTPTEGTAFVRGMDVREHAQDIRRHIGFMPADDRTLWLRQSCRENLDFHGRLQGMPPAKLQRRIDEVLDQVGLGHAKDRVGFALSSGMRARLQLARAILHEPEILILDEPTSSVDPVGSYELLQLIEDLTIEHQLAVLISSHRLDEIEALHDHVVLLDQGRVVYNGDLDSLRRIWERPTIEIVFAESGWADKCAALLRDLEDVDLLEVHDNSVLLQTARGIGELLVDLDGQVRAISAIRETRIRLHELLTTVLRDHGLKNQ